MDAHIIFQVFTNGLTSSMTIILIALGVTLIFGLMHIINFFHGELYMLGGFLSWYFMSKGLTNFLGSTAASFAVATVLSMAIVSLLAMLIERGPLRQWHGKLLGSFIVSMGFILILQVAALGAFGIMDVRITTPVPGVVTFAGITLSKGRIMVVLVGAVAVAGLALFLRKAKLGLALRAVEQDREAAMLQGVNYSRTCSLGIGIGAALAALAGSLLGTVYFVNPYVGQDQVVKAFATVVLGGMGSFWGTVIAGFVIGFTDSTASTVAGGDVANMLIFGIFMLVLLVRPRGFLGRE